MRISMFLALLLAAGLLAAGGAAAQSANSANGARFGDWTLRCGKTNTCALMHEVKLKSGGMAANVFMRIRKTQNGPRVLLNANTPDGVRIADRPRILVDDRKEALPLAWITCARQKCQSAALLTPQQQGMLMAGNVMRLIYRKHGAEKWTAVPVSLRGVTAGLAALAAK